MIAVTPEDMAIMAQHDYATLADWWCALNRFEWPAELPDEEPPNPVGIPPARTRRSLLMDYIENQVGHRECSWAWSKRNMPPDAFSDFYRGTYEGNADAKRRYREWLHRTCAILQSKTTEGDAQ
jgi:hypothetical protein